jgi:hypothetical protein
MGTTITRKPLPAHARLSANWAPLHSDLKLQTSRPSFDIRLSMTTFRHYFGSAHEAHSADYIVMRLQHATGSSYRDHNTAMRTFSPRMQSDDIEEPWYARYYTWQNKALGCPRWFAFPATLETLGTQAYLCFFDVCLLLGRVDNEWWHARQDR